MNAGIYKIINTVNNHLYVGSSKNLKHRKGQHFSTLKHNKHRNYHLQYAYNKYGGENFIFEIIEIIEVEVSILQDTLLKREQYWIDNLHPEYNIVQTAGSCSGYHHTEEAKRRISQNLLGKKKSPEHAKHIREGQKGKKLSPEHLAKVRELNSKKDHSQMHTTPVEINGVRYEKVKDACRILNIPPCTMWKRLNSEKYPNFIRLNKNK